MQKVYDFLGGRKILFALILMVGASIFLGIEKIDSAQWVDFMKWIFGIYAGGNAAEHISGAFKK